MGSHVKSYHASTIIQHIPLSPYTRHLAASCALIFSNCSHFTVYQTSRLNSIPPYPGDKTPERRRAVRSNKGTIQNRPCETQSSTYAPGLSTPSYPSRPLSHSLHAPLSVCYPRPPSRHPSNLNSIYPLPALHLLPPSTLF